jgi:hypothetical protein
MSKISRIRQVDQVTLPEIQKIIKRIEFNAPVIKSLRTDQLVVSYDKRLERAAFYKTPSAIMSLIGRRESVELYFLDTYERLNTVQHCRFSSEGYRTMELQIRYGISIIKGDELKLVEALACRDTPEKLLCNLLYKWVNHELTLSVNLAYQNFEAFIDGLSKTLRSEARKIGLNLSVDITHSIPDPVRDTPEQSITIGEENIRIQPAQFNEFLTLGFEAVLVPETTSRLTINNQLAITDVDGLKALLISWLQRFMRDQVTYNDLAGELQTNVRTQLINYWNEQMRVAGKNWKIGALRLSTLPDVPVEFKRERIEISVMLTNAEVTLGYTVVLYLESPELFRNARIGDFDLWLKEKLHKVTQHQLATVQYAGFLSGYDEYNAKIKQDLNIETGRVGYKVDILMRSDVFDTAKLELDFKFTDDEQLFETSLNDKIKLKMVVVGRIASLNHETWKRLLGPSNFNDLENVIKADVLRETRNKILSVAADDFYDKMNKEVPEEIRERIKALLISKYNVERDVYIHIMIENSVIRNRFDQLRQGSLYADINLFNGKIQLQAKFSVAGIDPKNWALFVNKKYADIEEERTSLREDVGHFFQKRLSNMVPGQALGDLSDICKDHYQDCVEEIKAIRFVTIFIENIYTTSNPVLEKLIAARFNDLEVQMGYLIGRQLKLREDLAKAYLVNNTRLITQLGNELNEVERQLNAIVPPTHQLAAPGLGNNDAGRNENNEDHQ